MPSDLGIKARARWASRKGGNSRSRSGELSVRPCIRYSFPEVDLNTSEGAASLASSEGSGDGGGGGEQPSISRVTTVTPPPSKVREVQPRTDVAWHLYLVAIEKPSLTHHDMRHALVLVLLVIAGQYIMALALLREGSMGVQEHESVLDGVMQAAQSAYVRGILPSLDMSHVCGTRHSVIQPAAHGLAVAMYNEVSTEDIFSDDPSSAIGFVRYQLRPSFLFIFIATTLFWIWRCALEVVSLVDELRLLWPRGEDIYRVVNDEEDETRSSEKRVAISPGARLVMLTVALLRFVLIGLLFADGYCLLCTTTKILDLILNALALEFIFNVDDIAAIANLSWMHLDLLQRVIFELRGARPPDVGKRTWRTRNLLYIVTIMTLTCVCTLPHIIKIKALYNKCFILCLTNGLTDGTVSQDELPITDSQVIFPTSGFCQAILRGVTGVGGMDNFGCWGWRNRDDEELSKGFCKQPSALEVPGLWKTDKGVEACLSFWFGQGLEPHAVVPALRRTSSGRPDAEAFGCRLGDLHLTSWNLDAWWKFFSTPVAYSWVTCKSPAFGPKSAAWNETSLTIDRVLSPGYFFRDTPMAPVELQAQSCSKLRKVRTCRDNPCRVITDEYNSTCDAYCGQRQLRCVEAFAAQSRDLCDPSSAMACGEVSRSKLGCQCRLDPARRECGRLQHAYLRCDGDPCKVVVSLWDVKSGHPTNFTSCRDYCGRHGFGCLAQLRVRQASCEVNPAPSLEGLPTCDSALPHAQVLETPLGSDAFLNWHHARMHYETPDRMCHCGGPAAALE